MPYRLMRFDTVEFPLYEPTQPLSTPQGADGTVRVIGGAFDSNASARADAIYPYDDTLSCIAVENTPAQLLTTVAALRALNRKRYRLWREDANGKPEWCWARLRQVRMKGETGQGLSQPLDFLIQFWSPWYGLHHGPPWYLNDEKFLNAGLAFNQPAPLALTAGATDLFGLSIGGDAAISNAVLTITAGSADITSVTVSCWDCEWQYIGTIAADTSLVVDCGAMSVTNNGVAAYTSAFRLTANHAAGAWFILEPGVNWVSIALTGGGTGATLALDCYEIRE